MFAIDIPKGQGAQPCEGFGSLTCHLADQVGGSHYADRGGYLAVKVMIRVLPGTGGDQCLAVTRATVGQAKQLSPWCRCHPSVP